MKEVEDALEAYLNLIHRKGASDQVVEERRQLLKKLTALLDGRPKDIELFRQAVDAYLERCPHEDRVTALTCAREYYYFWLGDMKKLAELTSRSGFTIHNPRMDIAASLDELLQRMAAAGFSRFPPSLEIYLGKLFEGGMKERQIAPREQILKAMLYLLDGQPYKPENYRIAVDAMLLQLKFDDDESRVAFLQLAREYFYYWLSFPPAAERSTMMTPF